MRGNTGWYIMFFWLIVYPFIYGFCLSRLFGLREKIDHWILFCLHIAVTPYVVLLGAILVGLVHYDILFFVFSLIGLTVIEGLVWQYRLKDRNFNGFFISLCCNLIFIIPPVLLILMMRGSK